MTYMFKNATAFNQDISDWNVGEVTNMSYMFHGATSFNNGGVALDWSDTGSLTNTTYQFYTSPFNQDVSSWDMSNVTSMDNMFTNATAFNQSLENWDVSNVDSMRGLFVNASNFNQNIGNWDVGKVTNMNWMFYKATFQEQTMTNFLLPGIN